MIRQFEKSRLIWRGVAEVPAIEQGSEVETGSTLQNGQSTAAVDIRHRLYGQRLIVGDRERSAWIDDVDQTTGQAAELVRRRLVGADVAVTIDLPRIDRNQFAVEAARRRNRDCGLPARRGTHDRDHAVIA